MWNTWNWYCGGTRNFHYQNVCSDLHILLNHNLGKWQKNHSYQERRTTDQLMHPSTFSPFCPTHKYPAITTPLEFYIYICINSFKRPGWREKHILKVLGLKKILTTHNLSTIPQIQHQVRNSVKFSNSRRKIQLMMITSPLSIINGWVSVCCHPDVKGASMECPSYGVLWISRVI